MVPNTAPPQQNPNLALFAQMAQQGRPPMGASPMPPVAAPNPTGAPPVASPSMGAPGAATPGGPAAAPGAGGQRFTPQQLAALGRNGDSLVAHLTPGEVAVPPEVQTPKVLATLDKAFHNKGAQIDQFTAGSPQSSTNPATGVLEYNFLSAILPTILGIGGAAFAPELLPMLAAPTAAAVGTGVGSAAGGLLSGQTPTQALLTGAGAGVGGYAAGKFLGPAAGAAASAPGATPPAANSLFSNAMGGTPGTGLTDPAANLQNFSNMASPGSMAPATAGAATAAAAPPGGMMNTMSNYIKNFNPVTAAGSAIGGQIGSSLGASTKSNAPAFPPGFNNPMHQVNSQGNWAQLLGNNNYNGPTPNFTGYDASAPNSTGWNFYPQPQVAQ